MWDEAVDDSLPALKLIPNWFVTSIMIEKLFSALYTNESILYFNEDSCDALFNYNGMKIVNIDLNDINLYKMFYEDDPDCMILILIRLLVWYIKFEKRKALKKR